MTEPTDAELWQLHMQMPGVHKDPIYFARAVLAKCGIDKEDNWKVYGSDFIATAKLVLEAVGTKGGQHGAEFRHHPLPPNYQENNAAT